MYEVRVMMLCCLHQNNWCQDRVRIKLIIFSEKNGKRRNVSDCNYLWCHYLALSLPALLLHCGQGSLLLLLLKAGRRGPSAGLLQTGDEHAKFHKIQLQISQK